ncbi:B1 protein-like [Diorhabda sublineata]|uniref:B1 protein-like n=1 Tax=Diorhabda sublineata TaxID=1163346 RepID=UPI0024E0EB5E|nr:B1 protein-like [Diorhabda sublineata]
MIFPIIVAGLCIIKASQAEVLTPEIRAKLIENGKKCYKESGVDMDLILKIKDGVFTDDPKLKEHLFCVNKSFGIQQQNGDFNETIMRGIVEKSGADDKKADELIKKCLVKKDSPENSAFESMKCIHSVIPSGEIDSLFEKI